MILRRARNIGLAAVALVGVTAFGSASAAIPDPSGKLNACYNVAMHNFRLVDPASTSPFPDEKACTSNETAIAWGQTGPQGAQGAKGDTGAQGPQGPKGDQGPSGNSFAYMTTPTPAADVDDVEYQEIFTHRLDPGEGPYTISVKFYISGNTGGRVIGQCILLSNGARIDNVVFEYAGDILVGHENMVGMSAGGDLQLKCQRQPNTKKYLIQNAKALVTAVGSLR